MKTKLKRFFKNLYEILSRPEMTVLPGQQAFFFILSLVPTITIIFYIASFLHISIADISNYFNMNLSPTIMNLLTPAVENTTLNSGLIIVLIVGIYISSNGTNSIIVTADNIYGIEQKPFLQRRIKAIIMVFIIILLFLFILLVPIFGNFLLSLIEKVTGYNEIYSTLSFFKTPFSWLVIFISIKVLYTIAPDKEVPSAHVNIGALFTSLGWIIATNIYLYYVGRFGNYTVYYSGLTNIAILMMWMYILAFIFVVGLGINYKEEPYEIEKTQKLQAMRLAKKSQSKKNK